MNLKDLVPKEPGDPYTFAVPTDDELREIRDLAVRLREVLPEELVLEMALGCQRRIDELGATEIDSSYAPEWIEAQKADMLKAIRAFRLLDKVLWLKYE